MAELSGLSPAKVVLLAVHYAADTNVPALRQLTALHPTVLSLVLALRIILTFLPESTEPVLYVPYIQNLVQSTSNENESADLDVSAVEKLTDIEARRQVRKLGLLPLKHPQEVHESSEDPLTLFLIHRAHKIDAETGLLPLLPQLLDPFLNHSEYLRTWLISTLLPLLRLNYEYYPHDEPKFSLETFEKLVENVGASLLLSKAGQSNHHRADEIIARDLRGLVGPWLYGSHMGKRRKVGGRGRRASVTARLETVHTHGEKRYQSSAEEIHDWEQVYEWLSSEAARDFSIVVHAVEHWDGPADVDYGGYDNGQNHLDQSTQQDLKTQYAQAALAAVYATKDSSPKTIMDAHRILVRVAERIDLAHPPDLAPAARSLPEIDISTDVLDACSDSYLVHSALLLPSNPLTIPNVQSTTLLFALLLSASTLISLGAPFSVKRAAELHFSGNAEVQRAELQRVIRNIVSGPTKNHEEWSTIRTSLLWLWGWGKDGSNQTSTGGARVQQGSGVFGKVEKDFLETEVLRAFLVGACYRLAIDTYVKPPHSAQPLSLGQVEKVVFDTAMAFYDNASNGNMKRGGVKRTSDITNAFREYFPQSFSFRHTDALLHATHSLSFYSLTLQHGVPFQPVNIRVHQDPILLIGKVLDQNPRSYTKLDDLLGIGRNLIAAGLTSPSEESESLEKVLEDQRQQTLNAERRIMAMAIDAALAEGDFDTAYSYVLNRMALASRPTSSETSGGTPPGLSGHDDISWRAAYQAGRYRVNTSSQLRRAELRSLEQRMELLTQALLLAPQSALSEILAVWRRCEEELNGLIAQESEEEERWNDRGDRQIPGGFSTSPSPVIERRKDMTTGASHEDAPMGLFDVARGAAAALSKSAFPLRNTTGSGQALAGVAGHHRATSGLSTGGSDMSSPPGSDGEGRVRKRDMVSNMVAGGLASGIGWVLGAPPG